MTEQPGPELLGDTGSLAPGDGRRSPSWPRSSLYAAAAIPLFYLPALFFGAGPNLRLLLRDKQRRSPPYLHDGRLLTLDDTVEFFNLVLRTRLSDEEKKDLVVFLQAL